MPTQREYAAQMIAQLRVLDPSISADLGTPERKIIDTVAEALAENQIDVNLFNGALDLDSKFGADLDRFVAIFGFARQSDTFSTGFVAFTRPTPVVYDVTIPSGTQLMAPNVSIGSTLQDIFFTTTSAVTLPGNANLTSVLAPVQASVGGVTGNVPANTITQFVGNPVYGVTQVTNANPTTNGQDQETDDELKIRFRNTVFRNLAGTQDQFMALAVATQFTTKANVVGPISRYREYIQVPTVDDATIDQSNGYAGNGNAGEYTSALSTIPYSKYMYSSIPYFISNNASAPDTIFFRQDADFYINTTPTAKFRGDCFRLFQESNGLNPVTDTTGTTTDQPNITFVNVLPASQPTVVGIHSQDIVLFEHSYMSSASRNDYTRNITNCVDVYIDGGNLTAANTVVSRPTGTTNVFTGGPTDRFYYQNFRRVGDPQHAPVLGNVFTPMFWQPTLDLPDSITVDNLTYLKGEHYWAVQDVSAIGNTARSRNGIEWSTGILGQASGEANTGPFSGGSNADSITSSGGNRSSYIQVNGYIYDKNVVDLQASLEGSKQVVSDVLAHSATKRYFKLDITVMYSQGSTPSTVNAAIQQAAQAYFAGQYFGTTIQLSDLLQIIHNTAGVDNVRWSKDLVSGATDASGNSRDRVTECNDLGQPLAGLAIDRKIAGSASASIQEVQQFYITGSPTGGTYTLSYAPLVTNPTTLTTAKITYPDTPGAVSTALSNIGVSINTPTGAGTIASPYVLTWSNPGAQGLLTYTSYLTGSTTAYNTDFFLRDNELPFLPDYALATDTLPGLIIRPRAQNVWNNLGV